MICEAVAQTSDELLDKFFMGEALTHDEIHEGLRIGVLNGELTPVLVGCATKNIGLHTLLDMCIDYMPNPCDLNPVVGVDRNRVRTSVRQGWGQVLWSLSFHNSPRPCKNPAID